jgi:hypothetical protein
MEAVVIDKPLGGVKVKLRLWTGEVLQVDRAYFPLRGPINVGDRLDVAFKEFKWVTAAKRMEK